MAKVKLSKFLIDVFLCSLSAYGGPEAHYGVFSSQLVKKHHYLTDEELTELISVHTLVPGPSSTQTITAIGYLVGGPLYAFLAFIVWALPAILMMSGLGLIIGLIPQDSEWQKILTYLPSAAIGFIFYAAIMIAKKVLKHPQDFLIFGLVTLLGYFIVGFSLWLIPVLLIAAGLVRMLPHIKEKGEEKVTEKPHWWLLIIVVALAITNEIIIAFVDVPLLNLYASFYRYGYSVIGGGQVVIPLMIRDLVQGQSLITLNDFLSGYAIDQAIPGPLFSFASYIGSRTMVGSPFAFLAGILGGISIFLPGILLVFFVFPLWKSYRKVPQIKYLLEGITLGAAGMILMTAINQVPTLGFNVDRWIVALAVLLLLTTKKVPAPLLILAAMLLGFIIYH